MAIPPRRSAGFRRSRTFDEYRRLLADESAQRLTLADRDFDTGELTRAGEYRLADDTYATLARYLAEKDPPSIDPALLRNVLDFYRDLQLPYATKRSLKDWEETVAALDKLRAAPRTKLPRFASARTHLALCHT